MAEGSDEPKMKDMAQILKEYNVDWHALGIQLGLKKFKLDEIDESYTMKQIDRKRTDMLDAWLDQEEEPTWEKIIEALKALGNCNRAIRAIKNEHMKSKPDSQSQEESSSVPPQKSAQDCYGRPTVPLLENFEGLKILEGIGSDYKKFGLHLLQDDTGNRVHEIERQYQRDSTDIKIQIARDWINGRGLPRTWHSLVAVLHGMDKRVLAQDIVKKLQSKEIDIKLEQ